MLLVSLLFKILVITILNFIVGYFVTLGYKPKYLNVESGFVFFSFFGAIGIVAIYSILITRGATISWGYFITIIMYHFAVSNKEKYSLKLNLKYILMLTTGSSLVAVMGYYNIVGNALNGLAIPYIDFCTYVKDIKGMVDLRIESYKVVNVFLFPEQLHKTLAPYHYFELWLTAFYSTVLKTKEIIILCGVLVPYFLYLIFLAIFSAIKLKSNYVFRIVIAAAILFVINVSFFDLFNGIPVNSGAFRSIFSPEMFKRFFFTVPVLLGYIAITERDIKFFSIIILTTALINILLLFSVGVGVAILFLIILFKEKFRFSTLNEMLVIVPISIFILMFIFLTKGNSDDLVLIFNLNDLMNNLLVALKIVVNFYALWWLVIIILLIWKKDNLYYIFAIASILGGAFFYAVLSNDGNAIQIVLLVTTPLMIAATINLINEFGKYQLIIWSIIVLSLFAFIKCSLFIYTKSKWVIAYSPEYLKKVDSLKLKTKLGAGWRKQNDNAKLTDKMPDFLTKGEYFCLMDKWATVTVNAEKICISNETKEQNIEKKLIASSDINFYRTRYLNNEQNDSLVYAQFISQFKFDFFIVEKNSNVPIYLTDRYATFFEDAISGERFYYKLIEK